MSHAMSHAMSYAMSHAIPHAMPHAILIAISHAICAWSSQHSLEGATVNPATNGAITFAKCMMRLCVQGTEVILLSLWLQNWKVVVVSAIVTAQL